MSLEWRVTVTIRDNSSNRSRMAIWFQKEDDGGAIQITYAGVAAAMDYLLPIIDDMINGQIIGCSISREIPLVAGLKVAPNASSDVEEIGVFKFRTLESDVFIKIPTWQDNLVLSGTDVIDTDDPDVTDFIFAVIDGTATPLEDVRPSDNRGLSVFAFVEAYEQFRQS